MTIIMDDGRCSAGDALWPSGFTLRLHLLVSFVTTMTVAQHWRNPKHAWRRHFKCDRIINNNGNETFAQLHLGRERLKGLGRATKYLFNFCLVEELPHDAGQKRDRHDRKGDEISYVLTTIWVSFRGVVGLFTHPFSNNNINQGAIQLHTGGCKLGVLFVFSPFFSPGQIQRNVKIGD